MPVTRLIYNIPIELMDVYRGRQVVVRVYEPSKLVSLLTNEDLETLRFAQILTLSADMSVLANWGPGVPVDIVMHEPEAEYRKLYHHAKLADDRSVRVSIPVRRGCANAVTVAGSLNFAVKLIVGQPTRENLGEMFEILEIFLHRRSFTQPVEFYQGTMQSFFRRDDISTWEILEEDPTQFRYVTAEGRELISPRLLGVEASRARDLSTFASDFEASLLKEHRECARCEFLSHCRGYFKWPNRDYLCAGGIKEIYRDLENAARELHDDLAEYSAARGCASV